MRYQRASSNYKIGDRIVVYIEMLDPSKKKKLYGKTGHIINIDGNYLSILMEDSGETDSVYYSDVKLIPPVGAAFQYGDFIRLKTYNEPVRGRVIGYYGDDLYAVLMENLGIEISAKERNIIPYDFLGEEFFMPGQQVIHESITQTILETKKTKNNWGQLLLIGDKWIPSYQVKLSKNA